MTKQTNEFNALIGSGVNSGYESMADGRFSFDDIFKHWIDTALKGESGITGANEIPSELAVATIGDKVGYKEAFDQELTAVNEDDAYDISAGLHGIQSIVSLVARKARKEGEAAGRAAVLEELKVQGVDVSAFL